MWLDLLLKLLITVTAVAALLFGWLGVQAAARRAAARHPEAGPYRDVACGGHCGSCGQRCEGEADAGLPSTPSSS